MCERVTLSLFSSLRMACSNCCQAQWSLADWNVLLIPRSHSPQSSQVIRAIAQHSGSPPPALSVVCQSFIAAQNHLPRNKWCFSSSRNSVVWVHLYSCVCFPSTFLQIILLKTSRHFSGSDAFTWQRLVNNKCFWALSRFCLFLEMFLSLCFFCVVSLRYALICRGDPE